MIEDVIILPEAVADATEAFVWYESREEGLGERFLSNVEECVARIRENPERFERVYDEYRRAIVHRFPYVLFYEYDASRIAVHSIFHSAQDPRKWRSRLS